MEVGNSIAAVGDERHAVWESSEGDFLDEFKELAEGPVLPKGGDFDRQVVASAELEHGLGLIDQNDTFMASGRDNFFAK